MQEIRNIYTPIKARLTDIIEESPSIKTFVLVPEDKFSFKTGQFIELSVDGVGEAPFTPSSSPLVTEKLEVTVMKTGYVTEYMHMLKPGVFMGIRGPYGRGYPVETFFGKEGLSLGGGCGLAPIRSLLYALESIKDKLVKVILCYGSKTPSDCSYKPLFDKININIEDSIAVVCGPPIMMKFGTIRLLEMGHRDEQIYLSMEKNMSCGLGKCGHCMMGEFFVCKDGPVFTYDEIKHNPEIWK